MLEDRRKEILRTLVEEYIRSGEPVSSRTICELTDLGVSTATVRSELAALERDGFVAQPHTSAGRIPTATAYRYYVDHLGPNRLRSVSQAKFAVFFDSVHLELSKLLKATSRLLADVTQLPAVVVAPGVLGEKIRDIHLVQLTPDVLLSMIVTEGGRILQERVRLERPIDAGELADVENLISRTAVGSGVGAKVSVRFEDLGALGQEAASAADAVLAMVERAAGAGSDVFVDGTRQMATVWEDLSEVQRVLEVVEREAIMLNILARTPGTSIQIGSELPVADVDMAVVSTTYESGSASGTVGVIGPMRMNYRRAISVVEQVSRELEDRIQS
ncbi:MAG TPA: heat-inducible transcriptional repressor HrcA [Acidimicrobiia bacterium]|nr:heat-inducible transcriptional repressor HrcA [Acidimicrobiia bacterium]